MKGRKSRLDIKLARISMQSELLELPNLIFARNILARHRKALLWYL